jgi:hydrogenase maturation protease
VGLRVVRALAERLRRCGPTADVDLVETEVGGFCLLELLQGVRRTILVDAISRPGLAPGTVLRLHPEDLGTTPRLRSVHEIDLPSVLALGRALGFAMPEEVVIFAVQAADMRTFGERPTSAVAATVPAVVARVTEQLEAWGVAPGPDAP